MTAAVKKISQKDLVALEPHQMADLFPYATDEEIGAIANDIVERGFRSDRPIILFDGQILDGRNRRKSTLKAFEYSGKYRAAYIQEFTGDTAAALDFVLSENLHRRHLTESQRALVAANIKTWSIGMNQHDKGSANVQTLKDVARSLSISERAVYYAKSIKERGNDDLVKAVSEGALKVSTAADLIKLNDKEISHLLLEPRRNIIAKAKEIRTENKAASRAIREKNINDIAATGSGQVPDLPRKKYPIIYCDYPWENEGVRDKETGNDKSPPYPTMPLAEIKKHCAGDNSPALDDAVIFFWITNNRLDDGIDILRAFGFDYVTSLVWAKEGETDGQGMGFWVRDCHEVLLIGKRGAIHAPDQTVLERSIYWKRKGGHSEKPVWVAEMIDRYYPDLPKLELFQRAQSLAKDDIRLHKRKKGRWSFWGYEAGGNEDE